MNRNGWTREQRRRYREGRQAQAKEIADRLLGKPSWKTLSASDIAADMDALQKFWSSNIYVTSPRHNAIITGIEGV